MSQITGKGCAMTDGMLQDRSLTKIAIAISAIALALTGVQAFFSYSQIQDLRHQFELSGAVLNVESSAQLRFNDGRREPLNLPEEQNPILTTQDFQTYDVIYLVYKVTNIGRLDTTLLGANLRITQNTAIEGDDPQIRSLCSTQGGKLVDCRQEFTSPPRLVPGQAYYVYFPLKEFWDKIPTGADLQGEISATGLPSQSIKFPLGIAINHPPLTSLPAVPQTTVPQPR